MIMRDVIWKFPLVLNEGRPQNVDLPPGALPVHVDVQDDQPTIWIRLNPDLPRVRHSFAVVGTGRSFDPRYLFVGTCIDRAGFVWHVLQVPPSEPQVMR
jgi:hypothetical protein